MRHAILPAALAVVLFTPIANAQQVFGGPDADRQASTALVFDDAFKTLAGVSISYSQPQWKSEYDEKFDELKGKKLRLGKNWWTTLHTCTPIQIGGKDIPAGSYVLGLFCNQKAKFSLLVFNSNRAMKMKMMPFNTESWGRGMRVGLKRRAIEQSRDKMEIEITADKSKPDTGAFAIRWGTHELHADVIFAASAPNLTGTWTGSEIGGGNVTLVVKGNKFRYASEDGREWYEGVLKIDHSVSPIRAVMTIEACSVEELIGMKSNSLLVLNGDRLKIAGNAPGDASYPAAFKTEKRTRVFELQRPKKSKRGAGNRKKQGKKKELD